MMSFLLVDIISFFTVLARSPLIPITELPVPGFEDLLVASEQEEIRFVRRLWDEWRSGINRFDRVGEGLYGWKPADRVIGMVGINLVVGTQPTRGRLRRMYVSPAHRRQGVGRQMIQALIQRHQSAVQILELYTDSPHAARFYESLGFVPDSGPDKVSHQLVLSL